MDLGIIQFGGYSNKAWVLLMSTLKLWCTGPDSNHGTQTMARSLILETSRPSRYLENVHLFSVLVLLFLCVCLYLCYSVFTFRVDLGKGVGIWFLDWEINWIGNSLEDFGVGIAISLRERRGAVLIPWGRLWVGVVLRMIHISVTFSYEMDLQCLSWSLLTMPD